MTEPTDKHDDDAFDAYLEGKSALSGEYRRDDATTPPASLDAAILSASREAIPAAHKLPEPVPRRWLRPLSIAAVMFLSVTLVVSIQLEEGILAPAPDAASDNVSEIAAPVGANNKRILQAPPASVAAKASRQSDNAVDDDAASAGESEPAPARAAESSELEEAFGDATTGPPQQRLAEELLGQREATNSVQATAADDESTSAEQASRAALMRKEETPRTDKLVGFAQDARDNEPQAIVVSGARRPDDALTEQLTAIATLWEAGEVVEARTRLEKFDADYPEFDAALRAELLPQALIDTE